MHNSEGRYRQSVDFCEDGVGESGPGERLRVIVVFFDVAVDGGLGVGDGGEHAGLEASLREHREVGLDGV